VETITFSGATDPAPIDIVGAISHLRCCCASMTDILPKYKDPNDSGKLSAHIFIDLGIAEAITTPTGRVDTWVTMHTVDPTGITVTAKAGTSTSFNIVFKPGAQFTILNSTTDTPTTPHFPAYYLMGIGSSSCTALPSDGQPCAAQTTECVIPHKLSTKVAKRSPIVPKRPTKVHETILTIDENCSNSHFP
jgi:hypothetical protein